MIIKAQNGAIIRLGDVADVDLGAQNYNSSVSFDGRTAVYVGIIVAPSANLLTVINEIRKIFPTIQAQLPQGLNANIVYDASLFVNSSIHEVILSLMEAFMIVTVVYFYFPWFYSFRYYSLNCNSFIHYWHFLGHAGFRLLH